MVIAYNCVPLWNNKTTLVPTVTTLHKVPISSAQDFKYAVAYGALLEVEMETCVSFKNT